MYFYSLGIPFLKTVMPELDQVQHTRHHHPWLHLAKMRCYYQVYYLQYKIQQLLVEYLVKK